MEDNSVMRSGPVDEAPSLGGGDDRGGMAYFAARARELRAFLDASLQEAARGFCFLEPWGGDVPGRLLAFARAGKLIRGGLVFLGQELGGGRPGRETLAAGAAIELIQSGFLIHDDIMDRDFLRRGMPSLHWQYRQAGLSRGLADAQHYGESMGICVGDAAFFLAFRLLAGEGLPPALGAYFAREVYAVCLAQMRDVDYGAFPAIPAQADIEALYAWKTGRYSFSLPLVAGAMLAGAGGDLTVRLEGLGEAMGKAFQMRDDELGLFGSEEGLGKPVGSDLREGKKTLLVSLAAARLDGVGRARLQEILSGGVAGEASLAELRAMVEGCGAREELAGCMAALTEAAQAMIRELPAPEGSKAVLSALADFAVRRES
jgi:geranylgeranyl diphosphate synthase type I